MNKICIKIIKAVVILPIVMFAVLAFHDNNEITAFAKESSSVRLQKVSDEDTFKSNIVAQTNNLRAEVGVQPVAVDAIVAEAAQRKSDKMAEKGEFAHILSDGTASWTELQKLGYVFRHAGENLAVHFVDSDAVVDAWHNSPTHDANLLNGNYTSIGIGVSKGVYKGDEGYFIVQLFATPMTTP